MNDTLSRLEALTLATALHAAGVGCLPRPHHESQAIAILAALHNATPAHWRLPMTEPTPAPLCNHERCVPHEHVETDMVRWEREQAATLDRERADYEQMRMDRGWPTPNHMRSAADALDTFTPARYGDVLRWFADLCDAALAEKLGAVR